MDTQVLALAKLGWRLHPLLSKNKIPLLDGWVKLATSDVDKLDKWEMLYPGCNWGVATGSGSGVIVVDVDAKNGGIETWQKLISDHGDPGTCEVRTGGGGYHFYFSTTKRIRNSTGAIGKGIDVRGEHGQAVIPPSIHSNGTAYSWVVAPWHKVPVPLPDWLELLIFSASSSSNIEGEFTDVGAVLTPGNRNQSIYHQALILARQNAPQDFVFTVMKQWCQNNGGGDIADTELTATIASAYKKAAEDKNKLTNLEAINKNDEGNARSLIDMHGKDILYVPGMGWLVWDGKRWRTDLDDAGIIQKAIDTMHSIRDKALEDAKNPDTFKAAMTIAGWATQCLNHGRLTAMVSLASKKSSIRARPEELDSAQTKFLINFNNGVLDLMTGELHPHSRSYRITQLIPHDYNPTATCPTWDETMRLAFNGDEDLIAYMQRALGYTMSGSTAEQCFFIAWGEAGNNGKSTILENFQRILGPDYAQMSDVKVITTQDSDNYVRSSLAALKSGRFVSMNEAEEGQRLSEALIKQLTGGDTVQACYKFKEPFTYIPAFKIWLRTNEKPIIRSVSDSIWRRIKMIPFLVPIPAHLRRSRDKIDVAIQQEAEGVLAWCVRGFQQWQEVGLADPTTVVEVTTGYKTDSDVVNGFMDECVIEREGSMIERTLLYQAFSEWSKRQGYKFTLTADSFGRRVARRLGNPPEKRIRGARVWIDLELTDSAKLEYYIG